MLAAAVVCRDICLLCVSFSCVYMWGYVGAWVLVWISGGIRVFTMLLQFWYGAVIFQLLCSVG